MNVIDSVRDVIKAEGVAVQMLSEQIEHTFERAVQLIWHCKGKVILSGVGKSGHIGKKIAASLASTGTPAFFVHATEGVHGDLGMIQQEDVVILVSNSGETEEVLSLLPSLEKIGAVLIAITSNKNSTLAQRCDTALTYKYEREADHLGLAPTTSTTLALVIGDALAVVLCKLRNFTKEDFHLYHPGGSLGQQLAKK